MFSETITTPGVFTLALGEIVDSLKNDRPRVVKAWASTGPYWALYKAIVPDAYVVARQFFRADAQLLGTPKDVLAQALENATKGQSFDALVGMNEYIGENASYDQWKRALGHETVFAATAKKNGMGYWALSMPTHNLPPAWVVKELAKDQNITGLSLHLYALEQPMQKQQEVARYREFIETCPLPVLIGETGRDGLLQNIGWQKQNVSPTDFAEELRWLTENLGAWAYTIFAHGCTQDWKDKGFETKDNVEFCGLLKNFDYSGFGPPKRKDGAMPKFEFAFKVIADELGADVVGEPLEDLGPLNYDTHGNVVLYTTLGVMVYNTRLNKAHFLAGVFPKASGSTP